LKDITFCYGQYTGQASIENTDQQKRHAHRQKNKLILGRPALNEQKKLVDI
jgi:hypothetical protein